MRAAIRAVLILSLVSGPAFADATLERGWLTVRYPEGRERLAEHVVTLAQEGPRVLERELGIATPPVTIRMIEGDRRMQEIVGSYVPPWALAVAISSRSLIVVRADKLDVTKNQLGPTLVHELGHIAMGAVERAAGRRLPQWFEEGLCEHVSGQAHLGTGGKLALDAALGHLFRFEELVDGFPASTYSADLAYVQSRAFVAWLDARQPGCPRAILARFAEGQPFERAFHMTLGADVAGLEAVWRESITPPFPGVYAMAHLIEAGTVMAVLCLLAYARRRRKDRELMKTLEDPGVERDIYGWQGPLRP